MKVTGQVKHFLKNDVQTLFMYGRLFFVLQCVLFLFFGYIVDYCHKKKLQNLSIIDILANQIKLKSARPFPLNTLANELPK